MNRKIFNDPIIGIHVLLAMLVCILIGFYFLISWVDAKCADYQAVIEHAQHMRGAK